MSKAGPGSPEEGAGRPAAPAPAVEAPAPAPAAPAPAEAAAPVDVVPVDAVPVDAVPAGPPAAPEPFDPWAPPSEAEAAALGAFGHAAQPTPPPMRLGPVTRGAQPPPGWTPCGHRLGRGHPGRGVRVPGDVRVPAEAHQRIGDRLAGDGADLPVAGRPGARGDRPGADPQAAGAWPRHGGGRGGAGRPRPLVRRADGVRPGPRRRGRQHAPCGRSVRAARSPGTRSPRATATTRRRAPTPTSRCPG